MIDEPKMTDEQKEIITKYFNEIQDDFNKMMEKISSSILIDGLLKYRLIYMMIADLMSYALFSDADSFLGNLKCFIPEAIKQSFVVRKLNLTSKQQSVLNYLKQLKEESNESEASRTAVEEKGTTGEG